MIAQVCNMWALFAPVWFAEVAVLGVTCSDHGCTRVATFDVAWPGRDLPPKCTTCRDGWVRVADAMGFALVSIPRHVREYPPPDDASIRFAMMEIDR